MDELHAAIAAYLRDQRPISDAEREALILDTWRAHRPVPCCDFCGRLVDDDGGLFNLADMQRHRLCADHYCPF